MGDKILIVSSKKSNIVDAITYKLEKERMKYVFHIDFDLKDRVSFIVVVDSINLRQIQDYAYKNNVPIIFVNNKKENMKNIKCSINVIITALSNDKTNYTETEKEFLFKKDIYGAITEKIYEIINDKENFVDGLTIDFSGCKFKHPDWVFDFDSIRESYDWLTQKNENQDANIEERIIGFYLDRLYDDSNKEIKYLIDRLTAIKEGKRSVDVYVCTKEELKKYKKNRFFLMLARNISSNYKVYIIDKDKLQTNYKEIYDKLLYGVIIYQDCVYRDYLDNEYSLGYVDCKKETINEYNKIFDFIIKELSVEVRTEGELDEL